MPRQLRMMVVAAAMVFVLSAAAMFYLAKVREGSRSNAAMETVSALTELTIPDFRLQDQNGRPFARADLLGRVTVMDFFFTHCPFICPVMVDRMGGLTRQLEGTDVRFVSISVDPAHDTPERLREYAELNQADTSRWSFLTGEAATIHLIAAGLKFEFSDDPSRPIGLDGGNTMSNISHPGWFLLIGPDGTVRGIYPHELDDEMARLAADARALAAKK